MFPNIGWGKSKFIVRVDNNTIIINSMRINSVFHVPTYVN